MRIIRYTNLLDADRKNVLIKQDSRNCPGIKKLDSPVRIVEMLNYLYNANKMPEEYTWLIALDSGSNPIGLFEISHGNVNSAIISPREIFIRLCLCGATSWVVAHNHPSGDTFPSKEDVKTTEKLYECGVLMDMKLLDHIIIGNGYYSFKENNNVVNANISNKCCM